MAEFALPAGAKPHGIAAGADRAVWFSEWGLHRVGRLDAELRLDEFELPGTAAEPHGITVAPDGRVWAALEAGQLVAITPT